MTRSIYYITFLAILSAAISLAGCQTHPFSGSGAMRIDVEVYKGPLSEEPDTQWGNLKGLLDQTERGLIETENLTRAVFANKGFRKLRHDAPAAWRLPRIDNYGKEVEARERKSTDEPKFTTDNICYSVQAESPWYYLKFWRLFGLLDDIDHYDCLELVALINDIRLAREKVKKVKENHRSIIEKPTPKLTRDCVRNFLEEVATLSSNLKFIAFRWSVAAGAGASLNSLVRIAQVTTIVATSEYANQLHAHADALLKQLEPDGLDRRELPPGVALREVEPTDFVHLYDWLNGNTGSMANALAGIGSPAIRVNVIERLFADHYWAKINTVYASGRGKVAMAFIKDDVGNWNLKSFDNDAEELLNAYTKFSKEVMIKAMEIAAKGAAPAPAAAAQSAAQLITLATDTAFGTPATAPTSTVSNILSPLRQSLLLQLHEKNEECKKVEDKDKEMIKQCLTALQTMVDKHSKIVDQIATGMAQFHK